MIRAMNKPDFLFVKLAPPMLALLNECTPESEPPGPRPPPTPDASLAVRRAEREFLRS